MKHIEFYLALDIGAGAGAKMGIFSKDKTLIKEMMLPKSHYGSHGDEFATALEGIIETNVKEAGLDIKNLLSIGICCAGILASDGTFILFKNQPQFNGYNIRLALENYFSVPTQIENDADAGGLAEWSVLKMELCYWVFGGGWGGVWISKDGDINYPSYDWDGKDSSLHVSNEPGYSIALDKLKLKTLFYKAGASYDNFEKILKEDESLPSGVLVGPNGDPGTLRAETILSGPGRCRLFRAVVGDDTFYERFLDIHEVAKMHDPSVAGAFISKLSSMGVDAAIKTDELYGNILAVAAGTLINSCKKDGMKPGIPLCLGGKPSYALPYFGPSCQKSLSKIGIYNYLRPSVIDESGQSANMLGALVIAELALKKQN
ncbi:ROK family protein [Thiospirochaeta perfilievii]|uniref:ROK family protein n=1 Tax=Thiospirochaeta perfilievii TaxID=252967 RepID=A0A5C1QHH9_9SPIO|nr:ROK family protein [Thiospirochaeta perfilievii]QEN06004.1 ROK family protein [Thiospirochaeta perfilievii]